MIGEIAESHHWPAYRVAEHFQARFVAAPALLAPAPWEVDALKVALLLRTADAAHIDGKRAPWFLFSLRQPEGISESHWQYQAKMAQPKLTSHGELRLSSGSSFGVTERRAWWLAFDAARMLDRELRDVRLLLRDNHRPTFAATAVEHVSSPELFSTNVRTHEWEPVNVTPTIGDIPAVIAKFGGAQLYGDRPELAIRELIQNGADAVRALRALEQLGPRDGQIEVLLERNGDSTWLHVTDSGIGMSRYVLTEVLLDFGKSLWRSESLRTELPGLASTGFTATGKFGIGFFSVFMLGPRVVVTTRRFRRGEEDNSDEWTLEFADGLLERPTLRRPVSPGALRRPGTRVSVLLDRHVLAKITAASWEPSWEQLAWISQRQRRTQDDDDATFDSEAFRAVIGSLCPALDVTLMVGTPGDEAVTVVAADDWKTLDAPVLLNRLYARSVFTARPSQLLELREPSGDLVGRVGHAGPHGDGAITNGGLRNGAIRRLGGIVLGRNSSDLARLRSSPCASREAWREWSETWLRSTGMPSTEACIDLHPLCRNLDLPVYRIGREVLDERKLRDWISTRTELCVLDELPTHEDYDDVSAVMFDQHLELAPDILVLPSTDGSLEALLSVPTVAYAKRVERLLQATWGQLEAFDEDDVCVAKVGGVEINRTVSLYERR